MPLQPVLINGRWREAKSVGSFTATNPATTRPLDDSYPISSWADCEEALSAAAQAAELLRACDPERIATFLDLFATKIEGAKEALVAMAHAETGLPIAPRLADVELPRTTGQLRQAAAAAREGSWSLPTIDVKNNIRSYLAPLGPVAVFGPNNFPFAFNSAAGGDFAAAIATGCPVIAKANSSHPGTTRLFAALALPALEEAGLPLSAVQLIYRTGHADGERLVADERLGASAYTGSRAAGLKLKQAADAAGKPIYLELSSVNPVVILTGALRERGDDLAQQFVGSCLMGAGQFCTNPGLIFLFADPASDKFVTTIVEKFQSAPMGTLLSRGVQSSLTAGVETLLKAGAKRLTSSPGADPARFCYPNTLLHATGEQFLADPAAFQTEAFGNASLIVTADDIAQLQSCLTHLEGNLTGCVYSALAGEDDKAYRQIEPILRTKVGRLLNDKMPTGVAVSPAMNHGGPYPATGHAGFTAVGIPASLRRFGMLQCFDGVRPNRLPAVLQDQNPGGRAWRLIDGVWTRDSLGS